MHEGYRMSESDEPADDGGQAKVETWMPVSLKNAMSDRADELGLPMAGYVRRLIREDLDEQNHEPEEIEAD